MGRANLKITSLCSKRSLISGNQSPKGHLKIDEDAGQLAKVPRKEAVALLTSPSGSDTSKKRWKSQWSQLSLRNPVNAHRWPCQNIQVKFRRGSSKNTSGEDS